MKKIKVMVSENQELVWPFVWINGKEKEIDFEARLMGEGANLTLVGIFLGTGSNEVVFNTNVVHEAPNTKSLTTLRGVFSDKSSLSNDGMVRIQKGAKNADGYFASKVLLFDDAKGRSVPSLEIDENELKAGHASTVGKPDENQILYLRSRGLSEDEATKLLVSGFYEPVLKLLSVKQQEEIKNQIQSLL